MYFSLVTFHKIVPNDTEKEGYTFAAKHVDCTWARRATQVEDNTVGYWLTQWKSPEHHEGFLRSKGLTEIVSRSNEFSQSFSVLHTDLGPDDAIQAVFSAPVFEFITIRLKEDTDEYKSKLTTLLSGSQNAARSALKAHGVLAGSLVEHTSTWQTYLNKKPGGVLLIGWRSAQDTIRDEFPALHKLLSEIGEVNAKHVVLNQT